MVTNANISIIAQSEIIFLKRTIFVPFLDMKLPIELNEITLKFVVGMLGSTSEIVMSCIILEDN